MQSANSYCSWNKLLKYSKVLCLEITIKCINSYQFIISISCFYMFRQLCAILREIVCAFCVLYQFGFMLIKFCVVCSYVYIMWRPGACRSVNLLIVYTLTCIYIYICVCVCVFVCLFVCIHTHISLALATKNKTEQCLWSCTAFMDRLL
jgi:hypothetical protein